MIYRNGIMKKIISILVAAMAAAAVCQAQEISPNAIVKDLSGSSVLMGDVLKNDVVIVSFWATWCKPCQAELDALAEIEDMWADQIRVVAIFGIQGKVHCQGENVAVRGIYG